MPQGTAQKIPFNLDAKKLAATGGHAEDGERIADALEFIAHYLDRIESHLAILASQSEFQAQNNIRM